MARRTERAVGRLLTALGLGRTPAADVARRLREIAGEIEAAIGQAGGTITINDSEEATDVPEHHTLA